MMQQTLVFNFYWKDQPKGSQEANRPLVVGSSVGH